MSNVQGNGWGKFDPSKVVRDKQRNRITLGRGFRVLSGFLGIGFVLMTGVLVGRFLLYVWIASSFDDIVRDADFDKLDTMDDLETTSLVAYVSLVVPIAVCWMVWQYRLAKSSDPTQLRRTPGWHAWSWAIPIGNLWLPFQNVSDLWRGPGRRQSVATLGWWWAALLVGSLLSRIGTSSTDDIDSVSSAQGAAATLAAGQLLGVVAAVLGLRILRTLTTAGLSRPEEDVAPGAPVDVPGTPGVW